MTAPVLTSTLDRVAPDAKARFEHNKGLAEELRSAVAAAALGGSEGSAGAEDDDLLIRVDWVR